MVTSIRCRSSSARVSWSWTGSAPAWARRRRISATCSRTWRGPQRTRRRKPGGRSSPVTHGPAASGIRGCSCGTRASPWSAYARCTAGATARKRAPATPRAGGRVAQQFTRGNSGWLGLASTVRRNRTTYTLEGQWTPKRNKFPTDPEEGGEFHGASLTAGLRQALGARARSRVEWTLDRERFVPQVASRDLDGQELFAQGVFSPAKGLDLRGEGSVSHDQTASRKYTKSTHWLGAGGVWSDSLWRADLGMRSGLRRFTEAVSGDSNFKRRDQWIELRFRLTRGLRPGLAVAAGATLEDQ